MLCIIFESLICLLRISKRFHFNLVFKIHYGYMYLEYFPNHISANLQHLLLPEFQSCNHTNQKDINSYEFVNRPTYVAV